MGRTGRCPRWSSWSLEPPLLLLPPLLVPPPLPPPPPPPPNSVLPPGEAGRRPALAGASPVVSCPVVFAAYWRVVVGRSFGPAVDARSTQVLAQWAGAAMHATRRRCWHHRCWHHVVETVVAVRGLPARHAACFVRGVVLAGQQVEYAPMALSLVPIDARRSVARKWLAPRPPTHPRSSVLPLRPLNHLLCCAGFCSACARARGTQHRARRQIRCPRVSPEFQRFTIRLREPIIQMNSYASYGP
jgi:hypothetical protein